MEKKPSPETLAPSTEPTQDPLERLISDAWELQRSRLEYQSAHSRVFEASSKEEKREANQGLASVRRAIYERTIRVADGAASIKFFDIDEIVRLSAVLERNAIKSEILEQADRAALKAGSIERIARVALRDRSETRENCDPAEDVPPEQWSEAKSPSEWATIFKCSWRTLKKRIGSGDVRAKQLTNKSYRIHNDDLPTK